ncbi:MAG: Rieske (2Fe-2S) protein [Comamonas sp.]
MDEWITIASWANVSTTHRALVRVAGHEIAVFVVDGQPYAIEDSCPHAGAALCRGALDGHLVQCPAHGLRFDLRTGGLAGCQDGLKARTYSVRVEGDAIQVQVPPVA